MASTPDGDLYVSPCEEEPWSFEAVISHPRSKTARVNAERLSIAACARCRHDHRAHCLELNFDAAGVIAGTTEEQRLELRSRGKGPKR